QGPQEAARLPRVRQGVYPANPLGGHDGVVRRRLCRLPRLRQTSASQPSPRTAVRGLRAGGRTVMATATEPGPRPGFAAGELRDKILRKCRESMATKEQFFTEQADRIAECCTALAKAFDNGARLFVMGNGGSSCDAAHVAVEFMHPIIEKRPPLPALALTTDTAI